MWMQVGVAYPKPDLSKRDAKSKQLYGGLLEQLKMLTIMERHAERSVASRTNAASAPAAHSSSLGESSWAVPQLLGLDEFPTTQQIQENYDLIVDAIFGFSFSGEVRAPFDVVLHRIVDSRVPVVSVDIPSGWSVEDGPPSEQQGPAIWPSVLVSLTAPKKCAHKMDAHITSCRQAAAADSTPCPEHWLGGRFLPPPLAQQYDLTWLPVYPGVQQCVQLF